MIENRREQEVHLAEFIKETLRLQIYPSRSSVCELQSFGVLSLQYNLTRWHHPLLITTVLSLLREITQLYL